MFREYEASQYPDPLERSLKSIELLQMSDIDLIQDSRWKYVALKHGGGRPVTLSVSDGAASIEYPSKASWKKF